jgi:serpin B
MRNTTTTNSNRKRTESKPHEPRPSRRRGVNVRQGLLALLAFVIVSVPAAVTAQVQSLVASNTAFALNLYAELSTNTGNLFFSPYSISTCLAMLYAGASGNTEQQMSQVLGFGTNQPQFASLFGELQSELEAEQETNAIELNIANALWTQEGFPFLPSFLQTATTQYQASVNQADFTTSADAVTQTINNWVAEETQNKIQNTLSPGLINTNTRLVLINAIYFLGAWTEAFAGANTLTQPFYLSATNQVDAPLMHQPAPEFEGAPNFTGIKFNYMGTDDFQAIELPYASNQVSMVILLPSQIDGWGQLEQQLSPAFLSNVLAQMTEQYVEIFLPRFTLESSFDLSNALATMGMPDAFTPGVADFSGIDRTNDLSISQVIHKAWGQVNEVGTEAAAVSVGVVGVSAGIGGSVSFPPVFRADHPFIFFIRDTQSGSVLFLGRLANPSQSPATLTMPQVAITRSGNGLNISWPNTWTGWTLQQSPDLTNWTTSGGISNDGSNNFIGLTSPTGNLFFRLKQ